MPDLRDETLVVVGERSDSAISCVPIKQTGGAEEFPIIRENPTVYIEPSLQLDFDRPYTVEPSSRVRNVGRVDRNYLKTLKARSQEEMGGDQFAAEFGSVPAKSREYREIVSDNPGTRSHPLNKGQ